MIDAGEQGTVSFSRRDLAVVAEAVTARFPLRAGEARRLARMRLLLASAADLNRTLATHTHRSLVHCQGSHGVGDIAVDTHALFEALGAYAALIRDTADAYRGLETDTDVEMRREVARDTTRELHAQISAQ
ncbi:MAG: hypothetical protein JWL95_872 [Gemmatimonadetes bacterium]|nr:hypothetical protein [Gemmatimonadota bacterium]